MRKLFLFLTLLALLLAACAPAPATEPAASTGPSTQPTESAQASLPPATDPTSETAPPEFEIPQEGTPLTDSDIAFFTRLLNYTADSHADHPGLEPYGYYYWYRYILAVEFDAPENVNLARLFYLGTEQTELTQAELDFIASTGKGPGVEAHRIDPSQASPVLEQFFGLTWEETQQVGLENTLFDSETGMYYRFSGDVGGVQDVEVLGGSVLEDGSIRLYYIPYATISRDQVYVATLVSNRDREGYGYRFLSNLPVT